MTTTDNSPSDASGLAASLERLSSVQALVIGDAMLDRYVYGEVERISPEAPIPVFLETREASMPGGAGNVVRNLAALGVPTGFVSVIGDDGAGADLRGLLANLPAVTVHLEVAQDYATTIKTRYVAGHQQLLRADREQRHGISETVQRKLAALAESLAAGADIIVLSDYGKGVLSPEANKALMAAARKHGTKIIADPKGTDFSRYRGAYLVTPNRRELQAAAQMPTDSDEQVIAAARKLMADCGIANILVTRSADGMTLVTQERADHLPAEAREVFDVSGAGDTVVAVMAAATGAGLPLIEAAKLANVAAGIVVGKVGTAVAYRNEVADALHAGELLRGERKLATLDAALDHVARWRRQGLRVGFTNGCFDLLHPGHLHLLNQARAACDRLVVALNSDASVKRLKGPDRPVQSEAARAAVLGSLFVVDLVVLFSEETPIRQIEALRPDVLVKGADYAIKDVVGASFVQSYGGKVVLAELAPGHSTTATIARLAK
jgi:D-beta-D-heptose 7-phosphate kinase/D-beta-D-heptose 1-phosphate adenosyltransferase